MKKALVEISIGKRSVTLLVKSTKRVVNSKNEKIKYDLQGCPLAIHFWILDLVPDTVPAARMASWSMK